MSKQTWIYAIGIIVILFLAFPHLTRGFAALRSTIGDKKSFGGRKKTTITGTASKGDDSGGVLTNVGE